MIGPIVLIVGFGVAGWLADTTAGLIVGAGMGLLITVAVAAGATWWARSIGSLLEPEDAWKNAPRPPGFKRVCEWVYARAL